MDSQQQKRVEIEFFNQHAASCTEYNAFSAQTNDRLIAAFIRCCALKGGERILDLGCGSGVFSAMLASAGLEVTGVDISPKLIEIGRGRHPGITFEVGDAECLPFADGSFDAVFLGGVIHHFPDPSRLADEVARVTRIGGSYFAFDPNRRNPFMYLYRDHASPFYSPVGVTPNERPVLVGEVEAVMRRSGFDVSTDFMSVQYTYIASGRLRWLLPVYNRLDTALFKPSALKQFRPFVLTWGVKEIPVAAKVAG